MKRPNLLYILSDQHSPYVAGCYGDAVVNTPNLDGLAGSGVILSNVYCPSPVCVPSRMSMLTGRYPYENQVWTNEHILDSGIPTFAHSLGATGYRPVLVGRMHSVGPDQLRGFTDRIIGEIRPNHVGGVPTDRGHVLSAATAGPHRISLQRSGPGQSAYQVYDEQVADAAVEYLRRRGGEQRNESDADPFAMCVGFVLPHHPFVARRQDYERYYGQVPPPQNPPLPQSEQHPYLQWWRTRTGIEDVTTEEIQRTRAAYWALVEHLDTLIGRILTALREEGFADNTLVVYLSDHGEQIGEHGLWWKQTYYEASVRVPALISWPAVIPAGQQCDRVIGSLDITATMLDAMGAAPLPGAAGQSLLGLLGQHEGEIAWADEAFSEYCRDEGNWITRMIRSGRWKLNYYHGYEPQLFDLHNDPHERHDLASNPTYSDVRVALEDRLLADWDPEEVAATMARKRETNALLKAWAQETQPRDLYRWQLRPEMNHLETVGRQEQG